MTVAELIQILQGFNQDLQVRVCIDHSEHVLTTNMVYTEDFEDGSEVLYITDYHNT
jgi:hypothetical protein